MLWEYKIIYFTATKWTGVGLPFDLGEHFDRLGRQGWELVRTEPVLRAGLLSSYTAGFVAFFKKPLKESGRIQ